MTTRSDRYEIYKASESVYEELASNPGYMVHDNEALEDLVSQDGRALVFASKSDAEEWINAIIGEEGNFYDY